MGAINPKDYVFGPDDHIDEEVRDLDAEPITLPSGRVIDEAGAEQLVEETREAVRKREANLVPGGKSLSGDGSHSPVVQIRVSSELRAALADRAGRRGVSVAKYAREVLEKALREQP